MNKILKTKLNTIPKGVGVYLFKDRAGRILYIGKAANLKNRVRSHFGNGANILKGQMMKAIKDIEWIETDDEKQAFILENDLIKKYKPRYNIQWRDDKSYLWVALTNEEWPRVKVVHQTELLRSDKYQAGEEIGPFTSGNELRAVLRSLRKIFPFKTCKNPFDKPCLQWHLGLCPAHGNSELSKKNQELRKYQDSLNSLRQFLQLYAGEPIRIEAYDISNIHGAWATGSMIVFKGNKPDKKNYRRFKIKTVRGANDVAMMKEIVRRRLNHPEWIYPDIILIDGGVAQLNAVLTVIGNRLPNTAVISLAKQEEEIYTEYTCLTGRQDNRPLKLRSLPLDLHLIFQAIRNEAHRFAIFYYRHLHRKQFKVQKSKFKMTKQNSKF